MALTGVIRRARIGSALGCIALAAATTTVAAAENTRDTLKIASWNLEWLIHPKTFKQLKATCVPDGAPLRGAARQLPCNVAQRLERSSRDFTMLARYARELDADVVALQEVDGPEAARLVFPDYDFCFTARTHVQNTGFAIRRGLPFRCGPDAVALSLKDSLRRGAEVALYPGEAREIRLLSVHLKSGCSSKPLSSNDRGCRDLARQLPHLEAWIDAQAAARRPFAVLGDFNRNLLRTAPDTAAPADELWKEIDDGEPPEADLVNAAEGTRFRNCVPGQQFRSYIDHIVLSKSLAARQVPGSFGRVTYSAANARSTKLSDHCPIFVAVTVPPAR